MTFDYETYQSHLDLVRTYGPTAQTMDQVIRSMTHGWRGLDVLDLGCGTGHVSRMLERKNYVISYDPTVTGARVTRQRSRSGGVVLVGQGEALPFKAESFDRVVMLDVLEHIEDDQGVASEAIRVLRPGGEAFVMVPEHQHLYDRTDEANGHVRRYDRHRLLDLFAACDVVCLWDYGFPVMRAYLALLGQVHDQVMPTRPWPGLGLLSHLVGLSFQIDRLFRGSWMGVELVGLFRKG